MVKNVEGGITWETVTIKVLNHVTQTQTRKFLHEIVHESHFRL